MKRATKGRKLLGIQRPRWKLFQRAQADAIGLAQGPIDGTSFGHAHLGVVEDQGRDIARMGIAVANEATALGGLVDCSFEDPEVFFGTA